MERDEVIDLHARHRGLQALLQARGDVPWQVFEDAATRTWHVERGTVRTQASGEASALEAAISRNAAILAEQEE